MNYIKQKQETPITQSLDADFSFNTLLTASQQDSKSMYTQQDTPWGFFLFFSC